MTKKRWFHPIQPIRALAALALGITITVAVAWTFSAEAIYQRTQAPTVTWNALFGERNYWMISVRRGTGWLQIDAQVTRNDGLDSRYQIIDRTLRAPAWSKPATALSGDLDSYSNGQPSLSWTDVASGWPMLSMRFRERTTTTIPTGVGPRRVRKTVTVQNGHTIRDGLGISNILPLRPVWPGFVVDVLVFSIPPYLLLVFVGGGIAMRRRSRRRRSGLCIACGYDLSGMDGSRCPECGRATIAAGTSEPKP